MTGEELLARYEIVLKELDRLTAEQDDLESQLAVYCPVPIGRRVIGKGRRFAAGQVDKVKFEDGRYYIHIQRVTKTGEIAAVGHDWVRLTVDGELSQYGDWAWAS